MPGITQKSGYIFYYGNPAGYLDHDKAVIDPLFQSEEMSEWIARQNLTPRWMNGVFERLSAGNAEEMDTEQPILKACRIWQLKPEVDWNRKFLGYDQLVSEYGAPQRVQYLPVYDAQLATNNLEEIWNRFRFGSISEQALHPLSISDVVELYDADGSECYYIDRTSFRRISF